eukprot:scaffold9442_cov33-Tisochrysis_lutea.AAC.1
MRSICCGSSSNATHGVVNVQFLRVQFALFHLCGVCIDERDAPHRDYHVNVPPPPRASRAFRERCQKSVACRMIPTLRNDVRNRCSKHGCDVSVHRAEFLSPIVENKR